MAALEAAFWVRDARLRSEWMNTTCISCVHESDLWMGILTSTARFISSHDRQKRLDYKCPSACQAGLSKNESESPYVYLTRYYFSLIHEFITAFHFINSKSFYGSCKNAQLNWSTIRSSSVSGCARCAEDTRGTEDWTPHRCPVMMNWGWWRERTPLWETFRQEIGTASTSLSPGWWLYSPVFWSLLL